MPGLKRLLCCSLILATTILFARNASGQTPDTKSKATGSISGRVMLDGKGAQEIVVAALGNGPNRRPAVQATTDSEGHYRLFGLAAGSYQVTALAPTLVSATEARSDFGPFYGSTKSILLSEAESVEDIDLKLARGGVITGRVTDADGKPLVEQQIHLQPADQNGAPSAQVSSYSQNYFMYQTDDRGIYRIYGLSSGRYKISVGADASQGIVSFGRGYYPQTFYPDVNDIAKATIIELNEGSEATNIDIKVGSRAETYGVSGRVVDSETGQPVPGVRPTYGLVPKGQNGSVSTLGGLPTNSRGEFHFDGLAPGHYQMVASSRFDGGNFYSDPVFFDVLDRDITDLELKAVQGLSISGVIMADAETNPNVVAKFAGLRISASVRSESQPQNNNGGWSPVAADGTFQINGLRSGKAGLFLYSPTNPNQRGFAITRIEHDGVDVSSTLEIQPGQSLSDLRVFVSFGTGVIRGTVKFENVDPPADARMYVLVRRQSTGPQTQNGAQTDVRGRFLITDLAPGTYEVTLDPGFNGPSLRPQPPPRPRPPLKQIVTVSDGVEVEITFTVDLKALGIQ